MNVEIVRGIINSVDTTTSEVYRLYNYTGRPHEEGRGFADQHYGLRTIPLPGMECISLRYGNNDVIVAENDGTSNPISVGQQQASFGKPGDTLLYTKDGAQLSLSNDGVAFVTTDSSAQALIHLNKGTVNNPASINLVVETDNAAGQVCISSTKEVPIVHKKGQVNINIVVTVDPLPIDVPAPVGLPVATEAFVTAVCTALGIPVAPGFVTTYFKAL